MIAKKMLDMLNKQINEEMFSGYLYLSMSAVAMAENLPGFSKWFRIQAQEELEHAMKFFDYINERGESVVLEALKKPAHKWDSPMAMFEETLKHEKYITSKIYELVAQAQKENDFATLNFLQWFVAEQVEEEASAMDIVAKLKMIGESRGNLFMIDHELGKRDSDD